MTLKMKMASLLTLAAMLLASPTLASVPTIDEQLDEMTQKLTLTETQRTQIRPLMEENRNNLAPLFKTLKETGNPLKRRSIAKDVKAEMERCREALTPVLTEDQLTKYDQMAKERRAKLRERMKK